LSILTEGTGSSASGIIFSGFFWLAAPGPTNVLLHQLCLLHMLVPVSNTFTSGEGSTGFYYISWKAGKQLVDNDAQSQHNQTAAHTSQ